MDAPAAGWQAVPDEEPGGRPEDTARGARPVVFHVLFGIVGALLLLNLLFGVFLGFLQIFLPDAALTQQYVEALGVTSQAQLFWNTALNLFLFAVVPMAWVYGTRVRPWPGGNRYLGFRDFLPATGRGLALGLGLALAVVVVSLLYALATQGPDALTAPSNETDNPVVQGIVDNLSIPLVLFVAFTAGFGEEVLFRGVLQKWLGWWPQAIVFGLSHAAGGDPVQLLATTLIGLLFGWLVHRGHSLWLVVAAHFSYDLALLSLALFAL